MSSHKGCIYLQTLIQASCHCGHYPEPLHGVSFELPLDMRVGFRPSPGRLVLPVVVKLETIAGKIGGRVFDSTKLDLQPKRNSDAAPQTRPWQGPMPQRVCSLASRQDLCTRR